MPTNTHKRVNLLNFMKNKKNPSQTEIAGKFGRTQPWLSQIAKEHPDAKLLLINGLIKKLEFRVNKVFTVVN